tara:strand:- start:6670 stop:6924 length:255 start_codon:yes stop_codon:yes gene_type:complete
MYENFESLNVEQLVEKQIELRKKLMQAHSMGMMGPASQIQNMIDFVNIEIKAKSSISENNKEREKQIEDGKDPDDNILNIGEIE